MLLSSDGSVISTDGVRLMRKHARSFPWSSVKPPETAHHHPLLERLLRREPVDAGTAHGLPRYTPIDMLQQPAIVRTLDEAVNALRHCDRLCTLIAVQVHCVKNTNFLKIAMIQHTMTVLLPLPRPEGDPKAKECVWRSPMLYAQQLDAMLLLQRLVEHFAASVFGVDHTRSLDAVRMVVPACIAAVADCIMRQIAADLPSEVCIHLSGRSSSSGGSNGGGSGGGSGNGSGSGSGGGGGGSGGGSSGGGSRDAKGSKASRAASRAAVIAAAMASNASTAAAPTTASTTSAKEPGGSGATPTAATATAAAATDASRPGAVTGTKERPVKGFTLGAAALALQAGVVPVHTPELNTARACVLDYFNCQSSLTRIYNWEKTERLESGTTKWLGLICADLAFPSDGYNTPRYISDSRELVIKNYPEFRCNRP